MRPPSRTALTRGSKTLRQRTVPGLQSTMMRRAHALGCRLYRKPQDSEQPKHAVKTFLGTGDLEQFTVDNITRS